METSLNGPSSDDAPLTSSSLLTAADTERVAGASLAIVEETSLNTSSSDVVTLATSSPPAAPDAGRVAQAAPEKAALLVLISRPLIKVKAK